MEWVETTGRTVAAALEAALDELGVDENDAEVVIVAQPKSGILGIGRSDARVRARVRPTAPRPKRPQRGRGREQRRGGGREAATPAAGSGAPATEAGASEDGVVPPERPGATRLGAPRRRRARGGSGSGGSGSGSSGKQRREPAEVGGRPDSEEREQMSVEEQATAIEAFVRGVVDRFGYTAATTSVRIEDEHIFVDVTGDDLGLLIGQRGRTLEALQELARTVSQRRSEEPGVRVIVDVAGFRARRVAALEGFVRRIAAEVAASGEAQELEPMSAADRKVVHDTVNGIDGVESTSEGSDPERYVVIRPAAAPAEESA